MNNREMVNKILEDTNFDPLDSVIHPNYWTPVLVKGSDLPHMKISEDLCGMTMVARWIRTDSIQDLQSDDLVDMLVGLDGRTQN